MAGTRWQGGGSLDPCSAERCVGGSLPSVLGCRPGPQPHPLQGQRGVVGLPSARGGVPRASSVPWAVGQRGEGAKGLLAEPSSFGEHHCACWDCLPEGVNGLLGVCLPRGPRTLLEGNASQPVTVPSNCCPSSLAGLSSHPGSHGDLTKYWSRHFVY